MSADIIQFPKWTPKPTIDSEAEMIAWMIQTHSAEMKQSTPAEAARLGKLVWAEFEKRGRTNG